jgi:hypothetical protein
MNAIEKWNKDFDESARVASALSRARPHTPAPEQLGTVFFFGVPLLLSADLVSKAQCLEKAIQDHDATIRKEATLAHNKSLMNLESIMDVFLTDALDPEYIIRERLHIEIEESLRTTAQEPRP